LLTFEQIKELIELVATHGLAGVEVERTGFRLKVDGYHAATVAPLGAPVTYQVASEAAPAPAASAGSGGQEGAAGSVAAAAPEAAAAASHDHVLKSPIVGTFYRSPNPQSPTFVEVGSRVQRGQVLCIVEAMKLMNEIESDVDGVIVQIYPQNAQPVEFGEPLFAIKTA
jgi:acetyl-CoA carboxylase biotin carboxyl carrier protein